MGSCSGQIATEYLIVTGFILAFVSIIFGYSYINYDQNIKINQVNAVLDTLANKVDYVYALGPDNTQFAEITVPTNVSMIRIVNLCNDGTQVACATGVETACDCSTHGGISRSGIETVANIISGPTTISRVTRTHVVLQDDAQGAPFPCVNEPDKLYCDGKFRVRVYWNPNETWVSLQKV